MASKEAKQKSGVTTGLSGRKEGDKPSKKANKPAREIIEEFKAYVPSRPAGSYDYGGGLISHTPAIEPRAPGKTSGTNPNLNNAQKMRASQDIFLKDISFEALRASSEGAVEAKDFAVYWNEPNNLTYTPAGGALIRRVDSRGVWMADKQTRFRFTNMCQRTIYLQLHVPLATVDLPKNCRWKVQSVLKTLRPGEKFIYKRRVPPSSRISPKKKKEFQVTKNKCLGADLLEFRVNIEDLTAANEEPLKDSDAVLRVESGSISDKGQSFGGICYQTLDFVPKDSQAIQYPDDEIVWLEELAAGAFDSLTPINIDSMMTYQSPKFGYTTVPVHPEDDYHNLRGIEYVDVPGTGGKGIMAMTLTSSTAIPRPLRINYESDPTAVFTDPALNPSVVIHVEDATWWSMYNNMAVFKYHHNAGGWLLWDEANSNFFNVSSLGAFRTTVPSYVSIETPLMVTTYATARAEDYKHHKGVKADYDRLVTQLEDGGLCQAEAELEADKIFVALCARNFPNDTDIRTRTLDWGQIFTTVLLGAIKIMLA